jgi:hypothetical protein
MEQQAKRGVFEANIIFVKDKKIATEEPKMTLGDKKMAIEVE